MFSIIVRKQCTIKYKRVCRNFKEDADSYPVTSYRSCTVRAQRMMPSLIQTTVPPLCTLIPLPNFVLRHRSNDRRVQICKTYQMSWKCNVIKCSQLYNDKNIIVFCQKRASSIRDFFKSLGWLFCNSAQSPTDVLKNCRYLKNLQNVWIKLMYKSTYVSMISFFFVEQGKVVLAGLPVGIITA